MASGEGALDAPRILRGDHGDCVRAVSSSGGRIAVLECRVGGPLDATNIVDPVAAAITSIDFDHEHYTRQHPSGIAREKAGSSDKGSGRPGALVPEVRDVS